MAYSNGRQQGGTGTFRKSGGEGTGPSAPARPARERPPQEIVKTWAFDSVGPKKYALQIKKASNGNPCLKIVEGVPQEDGTYRKFSLTVWSEDFARLFAMMDDVRNFIKDNDIRTPPGHKYVPGKSRQWTGEGRGGGGSGGGSGQGGASAGRPGADSNRAYPARQTSSGRQKSAAM